MDSIHGKIVPFKKQTPTEITIKVRPRTTQKYMEAAQAVFCGYGIANVNALGDQQYQKLRAAMRAQARSLISGANYETLQSHTDDKSPQQGYVTFATFTHAALVELRDLIQLKTFQGSREFLELYHALDNAVEHASDALYDLEHQQPQILA